MDKNPTSSFRTALSEREYQQAWYSRASKTLQHLNRETTWAPLTWEEYKRLACKFLDTSMDETRTERAIKFANAVLEVEDAPAAGIFRFAVTMKEMGGRVEYSKQRDHTAHTVNNWFLGWYIYQKIKGIRTELNNAMFARDLFPVPQADLTQADYSAVFGELWLFTALLHDVGYLLESGIPSLEPGARTEHVRAGISVLRAYFEHYFWIRRELATLEERKLATSNMRNLWPELPDTTELWRIAEVLRTTGTASALAPDTANDDVMRALEAGDAFHIWRSHYKQYGANPKRMGDCLNTVEKIFEDEMRLGINGNVRALDHGVCSGLILLRYSTMYHRLRLESRPDGATALGRATLKKLQAQRRDYGEKYPKGSWFRKTVWATAATAIHSICQRHGGKGKGMGKDALKDFEQGHGGTKVRQPMLILTLKQDPLAYLGVLVDSLQVWDRFHVFKDEFSSGRIPISNNQVKISVSGRKLKIRLQNEKILDDIHKELGCLCNVEDYLSWKS
jgi:hypothetical protein